MTSKQTYTNRQPDFDPVEQLDKSLTALQEQRTQQLTEAQQYQVVEQRALDRERTRLAEKYGKEHPRVQTMTARLDAHQRLAGSVAVEVVRSRERQAPLPEKGWRVQGGVYDGKTEQPLYGLSVYLSNANREPRRDLGYACTDEQGHYAISLGPEQMEKQKELYLTVADANRNVLCLNETPLTPTPNSVELRDLYIGKAGCRDPFSERVKE
jgi:hypothetical protein